MASSELWKRHLLSIGKSPKRNKDSKKISRKEILKRNKELVYSFLQGKSCVDCGYDNWLALEFDHVRGEKLDSISKMIRSNSIERILEEIGKCEIRCCNCHRLKTITQLAWDRSIDK